MTAPKMITSSEVALAKREASANGVQREVGKFPAPIQAQLDERRTMMKVAAEIAGMTWGRDLNQTARMALARWGLQHGIDVTSEVEILGGKPYLTSAFFDTRAAALQREGIIQWLRHDHITADPRLDALAQSEDPETARQARAERDRRAMQRIAQGAPENAKAIVVCRVGVVINGRVEEFTGCKWTGTGKKKDSGKFADPVGEEFPVETAETRARRRALKQVVEKTPQGARLSRALSDDGEIIVEAIAESVAETRASHVDDAHLLKGGTRMVATEPYDETATVVEGEAQEYDEAPTAAADDLDARRTGLRQQIADVIADLPKQARETIADQVAKAREIGGLQRILAAQSDKRARRDAQGA